MLTVRDVGTLALKKLGVVRANGQASPADAESFLASLQSYILGCINARTFGNVANVVVSTAGSITAALNQHINATIDGVVVDLPQTLPACFWYNFEPYGDYGWPWCNPVGYGGSTTETTPADLSVVMVTSSTNDERLTYLFDATVQRWLRIDNMTLNDEAPLSARDSDGLASVLALRLSDEYGIDPRPATIVAARRFKLALVEVTASYCGC